MDFDSCPAAANCLKLHPDEGVRVDNLIARCLAHRRDKGTMAFDRGLRMNKGAFIKIADRAG